MVYNEEERKADMRELIRKVAEMREDYDIFELSRDYSEGFETSKDDSVDPTTGKAN